MRTTVAAALTLLSVLCPTARASTEPDRQDLARKTLAILKTNCYRCHGQDGANEGGLNYILDLQKLIYRKKVTPGDAGKSRLLKRLTSADDPMPPAGEKLRPSKEEIALLRAWIEAGAPEAGPAVGRRDFLAAADLLRSITGDLDKLPERSRRFTRYLTLTHLYNAGLSEDELQSYRHALSKLVNSLSWGSRIVVPQPVDLHKTIFRIDLRDYQWNEKVWDAVLAANPYGVGLDSDDARACRDATRCGLPYVRGDWFVAAASRPPLYHEVLQVPVTEQGLEKMLRVDTLENVRQEKAARAAFNSSGVSRNNRLIERHESAGVVYWKSYDFAGNVGRQNLFAHPLGPGDGDNTFHQDGGEIIFSLPNGLQGYMLVDAGGKRIDKGPTAIVSDPRRPDRAVENGISCMSCHARGMIEKFDQVRGHVLQNAGAFSKADRETILALYPPRDQFAALLRQDARRFKEAVEKTGAPLSASEPIVALALRFEAELDLPLAAAEVGVSAEELLQGLEQSPRLARQMGPLRIAGGTVQRQVFVNAFPGLVRALRLGRFLHPKNGPAALAVVRGDELLEKGDAAAAVKTYTEAVDYDPDNVVARLGRGRAYRAAGDSARALADFTEAIRLDPVSASAHNARAAVYHDRGDLDRAIADYTEALRLEPGDAVALNNRGLARAERGDLDRAIADYTEAIRLDADYAVAYRNRAQAHQRKGESGRALADFTRAVQINPRYALAYHGRAALYHARGDYDRAIADYTEVIRLQPKSATVCNNRGLAYYQRREYDRAVADYTEAIRLDAKFARAYFNRSLAYRQQGETALAEADREQAIRLDPALGRK